MASGIGSLRCDSRDQLEAALRRNRFHLATKAARCGHRLDVGAEQRGLECAGDV